MALPLKPITVTASTLTLDRNYHRDTVTNLNRAAGIAVTLPAATGSGDRYYLRVGVTITSNSTTLTTGGSDTYDGFVSTATTTAGAGLHEAAGGSDHIITMNGTTTGGIIGSIVELVDVASTIWSINGHLVGSGTLATSIS